MGSIIKTRLPLLLLLGIVFLASVSVSFGLAYWEKENPSHDKCLKSCNRENDAYRHPACQARCNLIKNTADSHESEEQQPWRQRGRHQGQEQEEREQQQEQEQEQERRRQQEQEQEQEQERRRKEQQQREQEEEEEEERQRRREKKREEQEEEREQEQQSRRKKNPYHFSSKRFQTRYKNQYGQIRVLQRFNQRSKKFQNLQYYGIVEFELKPNTLFLPHHSDADFILVVRRGKATITVLFPDNRESYNLEGGDAMRLPAGITAYILNRDNSQNLTVVKLAISVNRPGKFEDFFLTPTPNKPSYIDGFSRNFLEASYNTTYEEIQRNLLGDKKQEQSQEEGVIVQVSEELIRELTKHAKSSSKKGKHSESGPFNLRSSNHIYSNKFGKFYEVTPDKNPQLQDLDISLTSAEINEGALMLPHFNSKTIVVVVVDEGEGRVELVGLRKQQQQEQQEEEEQQEEQEEEEEEGNRQVHRYTANLSQDDIFIIPAGYPVAFNASSFLHLLGFGINAENNQRSFLAGEKDNVISLIQKQVKELAFPGSGKAVESLIKNQKQSYFANAQPQQREEGKQGKRGPLSSILGAFY